MNELSHFLIAVLNDGEYRGKRVIDPKVLDSMLKPIEASDDKLHQYGIGFRLDEIDGHRTFGHGGAVYGYSTQLVGLPDEKVGVVGVGFVRRRERRDEAADRVRGAAACWRRRPASRCPKSKKRNRFRRGRQADWSARTPAAASSCACSRRAARSISSTMRTCMRLRATNDGFIVDDLTGFGPEVETYRGWSTPDERSGWTRVEESSPVAARRRDSRI